MALTSTQQRMALCFVIAAVFCHPTQGASRSLNQDALSNSNGCLPSIPKCEAGACATRNIMGNARWVCLRCSGNYAPVVDTSGQDNIVQCVCPKGHYEANATAASCTRCPSGVYCPGGDLVEYPASRGSSVQCGAGLVTRNTGARSQADCVAPAGFAMTNATAATACNPSEYAPAYNRLGRCLRCQSGLAENPAQGLVDGGRVSKRAVCKVPPGRYISQGLVRTCPQGFYRENFTDYDAAIAQKCVACNPGITTDGAGAEGPWRCNKVLPGYGVAQVTVSSPQQVPALPQDNAGLPNATVCQLGYYSIGGYCAQCPNNTITRVLGAQAVEQCVVPPGYVIASGSMTQCTSGSFREGWVMYSDPKATTCTACGDNIASEARDLDEHPLAANGSYTRASSACCFIEAGQGMTASTRNAFTAKDCPINTYGVTGRVYGWNLAPCKPCPRNMITDGAVKVNTSDACVNDDGFGYASEGSSRCTPGFYAVKGSRKPCQQCPPGRTTADAPLKQRLITDCVVAAGYGVVNATSNATDAFNPDTTNLTDTQLLALPVLECPIGYYGPGNSTGAECIACPSGSTTTVAGATGADACTVCIAGYGKASPSATTCTPCPYGTYQPGGLAECEVCPTATFYPPVAGSGPTLTSPGTTIYTGSYEQAACVPKQSQMSPEAGQAFFSAATTVATTAVASATTLDLCVAACPANTCCFAQLDGTACTIATLAPSPSTNTGPQLVYKLPPSTLGSASSVAIDADNAAVSGKMLSSGYYASGSLPTAYDSWFTVGSNLTASARTFSTGGTAVWDSATTKEACKKKCDDSNVCIGFIMDVVTVSGVSTLRCSYRGGVDSVGSRSFFAVPADTNNLGW